MKLKIELEEAFEIMEQYCKPIQDVETISIADAHNRILAKDVVSPLSQPPFNKSAMDGYAFHYEDTINATKENPVVLEVVDTVYAGDFTTKEVKRGQAIQIMTGGCVPKECTAILRQEDTNDDIHHLEIYRPSKYMDCICIEGEDFNAGDLILHKGQKLDAVCLAILSSVGIQSVEVYRKAKLALCVTGSEVTPFYEKLEPGKIYDSNQMLITQRAKELGYAFDYVCHIRDDEEECASIFSELSKNYDFILSTGAVSVGKKDIIHSALDICKAKKIFWKLKLKPGSPTVFSMLNGTPILSLSGNPFAAVCIFELLGRKVLSCLSNDRTLQPVCKKAILDTEFLKESPQRRFIRAIYHDGHVRIPAGMHSNNELASLIGCNAMIDVEANNKGLKKDEVITIWKV